MKLEMQLAVDLRQLVERFAQGGWIERSMLTRERCVILFTPLGFQRISAIASLLRVNRAFGMNFSALCVDHFQGFMDELSPSLFVDSEFRTLLALAEAYDERFASFHETPAKLSWLSE